MLMLNIKELTIATTEVLTVIITPGISKVSRAMKALQYITYRVTKKLDGFFPRAKQADVTRWEGISKSDALKNVNELFHLDRETITRNKDGFHIVK